MTTLREALDMEQKEYAKFEQEMSQFWRDPVFGAGVQGTGIPPNSWEKLKVTPNEEPARLNDVIDNPSHYTEGRCVEPIDAITDWELDFCLGNVVKYISRAGRKDKTKTIEDLKKARFYLDYRISLLEYNSQ